MAHLRLRLLNLLIALLSTVTATDEKDKDGKGKEPRRGDRRESGSHSSTQELYGEPQTPVAVAFQFQTPPP